jgi:hypothetical protein
MELNLKNIYRPCQDCYNGYKTDDVCQRCEFNIAIQLLITVLKFYDGCKLCKNRDGEGYWNCEAHEDCVCNFTKEYVIDWEETFKEYGFNFK